MAKKQMSFEENSLPNITVEQRKLETPKPLLNEALASIQNMVFINEDFVDASIFKVQDNL